MKVDCLNLYMLTNTDVPAPVLVPETRVEINSIYLILLKLLQN